MIVRAFVVYYETFLLTKPEKIRMLENSSIKNGDEQEEYIFKTLRESGSLAERPLGNT